MGILTLTVLLGPNKFVGLWPSDEKNVTSILESSQNCSISSKYTYGPKIGAIEPPSHCFMSVVEPPMITKKC